MKLWLSGEIDASVSEKFRLLILKIEPIINSTIEDKRYGSAINIWGYISIIMDPNFLQTGFFKEIKRYRKKKKETEFRLRIDYNDFLKADDKKAVELICESILRSIDIARKEFHVKDFDIDQFRSDFINLLISQEWLDRSKIKDDYDTVPGVFATKVHYIHPKVK